MTVMLRTLVGKAYFVWRRSQYMCWVTVVVVELGGGGGCTSASMMEFPTGGDSPLSMLCVQDNGTLKSLFVTWATSFHAMFASLNQACYLCTKKYVP